MKMEIFSKALIRMEYAPMEKCSINRPNALMKEIIYIKIFMDKGNYIIRMVVFLRENGN